MKKIAIIGLGYVGLPLAALCATKGYPVIGLESNSHIVQNLKNGKSHIKDKTVEKLVSDAHLSGNLTPTSNKADILHCQIYIICVPTPVDANQDPDLRPLESAIEVIAPCLSKNNLVIVESTVFPGTCEQVVIPMLETLSKMRAGQDFHVAHCPERVNPGDLFWTPQNIPRVVGSTSDKGAKDTADFYSFVLGGPVFDVRNIKKTLKPKFSTDQDGHLRIAQVPLGSITMMRSIRDAEAVKAMENTVRDVNIAFVNELAKISNVLDLDVVDIIDGMATKPFGKGPFYPGAGVGGHCIAVDPEWLKAASMRAGFMPEIIQLSRKTNNSMPQYTVSLLQELLNEKEYPVKGTKIAILGVAYKKNVDDPRESPFYQIRDLLKNKGAQLSVYDNWITSENTAENLEQVLEEAKAILIVTDHTDIIKELNAMNLRDSSIEIIVDGRNCLDTHAITQQGVLYRGIGRKA